jgi:hypothetical protein
MAKRLIVLTPNRAYAGTVAGVKFTRGIGLTESEGAARDLAGNYKYVVLDAQDVLALADMARPASAAPAKAKGEERAPKA